MEDKKVYTGKKGTKRNYASRSRSKISNRKPPNRYSTSAKKLKSSDDSENKMELKKIIVDCDAGTDDAVALIILIAAHKDKKLEIKGITCVGGNTHLDNVVCNVYKTLEVCDALDIPVYKGARTALINTEGLRKALESNYHGNDGLGDVFTDKADTSKVQSEHAALALHRIASENPGEITLVCLAPLTNIALAIKIFPDFVDTVKEIYAMGGNSTARGNITAQAEFNFYADPESAHILLDSINKPLVLLPWETCLKSKIPMTWRDDVLGKIDNPIVKFVNAIEQHMWEERSRLVYGPCDALLAAIIVRPDMITEQELFHADIELSGSRTRGQVVLDHLRSREPNVQLVLAYDSEIFKEVMLSAVQQP